MASGATPKLDILPKLGHLKYICGDGTQNSLISFFSGHFCKVELGKENKSYFGGDLEKSGA